VIAAHPPPGPVRSTDAGANRLIELPSPIDLASTMASFRAGGYDPSMRFTGDGVWRASRTPDGAASLYVRAEGTTTIRARAWGPGAAWALSHAHELVGALDDVTSFAPEHRLLVDLHRRHPGLRFGHSRSIVEATIPTIIGQKVTSAEALRSYGALMHRFGDVAPGPLPETGRPPLLLRPDPARIARLGYADLHRCGIERRRAETMLRVCRVASSLDRLAHPVSQGGSDLAFARDDGSFDLAALRNALASIAGIGPWTSATVMQQAFGDADAVIVGDYHLPNIVAWNLAGEARADDDRMLELLEPFAPHRARVVRLLARGGAHAPRRGPGRRLRTIANL